MYVSLSVLWDRHRKIYFDEKRYCTRPESTNMLCADTVGSHRNDSDTEYDRNENSITIPAKHTTVKTRAWFQVRWKVVYDCAVMLTLRRCVRALRVTELREDTSYTVKAPSSDWSARLPLQVTKPLSASVAFGYPRLPFGFVPFSLNAIAASKRYNRHFAKYSSFDLSATLRSFENTYEKVVQLLAPSTAT